MEKLARTLLLTIFFLRTSKRSFRPNYTASARTTARDPLSLYLFILAIDPLQKKFQLATEEGSLSALRGRHARLRLSLYADDAVIFLNPVREEVEMVIQIMRSFGDATGLRINLEKSSVAAIQCQNIDLDNVLAAFPGQRVSFPITYLGIPMVLGRLRIAHIQPV